MKIKNIIFKAFTIFSIVVLIGCETSETQTVATLTNLVWADQFDTDGAPNSENWNLLTGDGTTQGIPGWGNNELQIYTDRSENVSVQDGVLIITAKEENYQVGSYTSANL